MQYFVIRNKENKQISRGRNRHISNAEYDIYTIFPSRKDAENFLKSLKITECTSESEIVEVDLFVSSKNMACN